MMQKRNEVTQAMAVGVGVLAVGLLKLSETTRRAAIALDHVATSLAKQEEEEPTSSNGGSGATGPTGPYGSTSPYPSPYESWTSSGTPPANP